MARRPGSAFLMLSLLIAALPRTAATTEDEMR